MDNGSITFFDIKACGFYRLKKNAEELDYKFGSPLEIFTGLSNWVNGKNFEDTIPWDINTHPLRSKTYCRGIVVDPNTNDIVVVIYRAIGGANGNLHGVRAGSLVGSNANDTVVAGNEREGEAIVWGDPCYYWIIPEHNKMASIIFPHSGADTFRFTNYVTNFVNNKSTLGQRKKQSSREFTPSKAPDRVVTVTTTTFEYGEGKDKCNCLFKFDVEQTKINTAKANLAEIRERITHTIIRDTTTTRANDERQPILKVVSNFLRSLVGDEVGEEPAIVAPKKIEVIIDGAPSEAEIEALFAQRADETDWVDVGFKVKDSEIPIWLTKYIVKSTLAIADSDGINHYSPQKILDEINRVRADLLENVIINQPNEGQEELEVAVEIQPNIAEA
ncbi:hypothetical protein [Salmonella enterica]|uniref:hypothetical protein n=1 Tax=Salmonella enterica TaxID=28901 RepID=UPI000B50C157|nr:hypothetical protein [Salmonella enterica]EBP9659424.1 hypothetical protein [Salmonella enterica subsp. enterica]ASE00648.1 hypothetical protein LFZ40_06880 [Salmonella enterica subsp. enterica serovar Quebec str. S-1267]ECG1090903.1 hypothetical protein [Salmonella enterica subsp. enterica]ECI5041287.1 hypothetical protein [Salmonella enterica subsp. enterica]EIY0596926.1 hypothetical protein [Salmonella enterica]